MHGRERESEREREAVHRAPPPQHPPSPSPTPPPPPPPPPPTTSPRPPPSSSPPLHSPPPSPDIPRPPSIDSAIIAHHISTPSLPSSGSDIVARRNHKSAMKINLKYQLCALVTITALFAVGLLAIITWYYSNNLVSDLRSSRLEVIAALKSKELSQTLLVFTTTARSLAARANIVNALAIPEAHENFTRNWTAAGKSFSILLSTYPDVLYVSVQNKTLDRCYLNITSIEGYDLLNLADVYNLTQQGIYDSVDDVAAWNAIDGAPPEFRSLIPAQDREGISPEDINGDGVFLGPVTFERRDEGQSGAVYVASLTVPVFNNTTAVPSERDTMGYMTVVFNIHSLLEVTNNTMGLGETGQVLLLGPENRLNRWNNATGEFAINRATDNYQYILPPKNRPEVVLQTQPVKQYPRAYDAWHAASGMGNYSSVSLDSKDGFGQQSSIGFATVAFDATNSSFLLIVQQAHSEAFEPMYKLRRIVVGTVFGTVLIILITTFPIAHFAVRPIRRLHEATKLCGRPPEYREEPKKRPWWSPLRLLGKLGHRGWDAESISDVSSRNSSGRRDNFRIPQKVPVGRHFVKDELTALVDTFNAMTEELLGQYEKLEEKVQERTEQLQQQTILAESANEAKTMFIANVSHELRTPLNGILGMCSLVLEETNLPQSARENLGVVFKSGELLLHLLTDLITFSKNQVWGAQVKMETGPFLVREFISQVMAFFTSQAKERKIELTCEVMPSDGIDFVLVGDVNRILQVIINLISNALKFTGENGSVMLRIVIETMPDAGSMDITPYTEVTEKDYMASPIFFKDTPGNWAQTTPPLSPSASASPSSPVSQTRPSRPPLFTRHSTASGPNNAGSDVTKAFLTRSKRLLNPETAADAPRSRAASPSTSAATHWVEFRVIDTGPGVPEHMQQKIFEPFVQADVGLSRKYGGTGLGLSICQQLSKLMGGDIHLKSFEGAGSTFSLRIPMQYSSASQSAAGSSQQYGRPLSVTRSRRSAQTTTRSLSAFSGPAFSGRSTHEAPTAQDGNMRLVGLSQPFFVPSRAESMNEFEMADQQEGMTSASDDSDDDGSGKQAQHPSPHLPHPPMMTPVVEVTTPGTMKGSTRMEFPMRSDGPSDSEEKPGPGVSIVSEEDEEEERQETDDEDEEEEEDKTIRCLVVEDNKINQKLVVKVLQLEKVQEITVAEDGVQAVDKVKEVMAKGSKFDIIFMDIQMPNMDGLEATRQIRALGYGAPIVSLTAFAEESNIKECYESGMDCFLSKPIKRPQIKQMVSRYCPGKLEGGAGGAAK